MENKQEKKVMETEDTKDIQIDLEEVGDKVVGGNLVPRDVASRAAKERRDKGYGVNNTGLAVFLDF